MQVTIRELEDKKFKPYEVVIRVEDEREEAALRGLIKLGPSSYNGTNNLMYSLEIVLKEK